MPGNDATAPGRYAPLVLAFGALLTDGAVEAVGRDDWAPGGWDGLASDDRAAAAGRPLTRARLIAGAKLAREWAGGRLPDDPARVADRLSAAVGKTLERALADLAGPCGDP
jgi:hypothetical protein